MVVKMEREREIITVYLLHTDSTLAVELTDFSELLALIDDFSELLADWALCVWMLLQAATVLSISALRKWAKRRGCLAVTRASTDWTCLRTTVTNNWLTR